MNPDFPQTPREELETRLTALLLGELPAEQAAALRVQIAQDPELASLHERLKQTISLVREVTVGQGEPANVEAASLKLTEERREKLLAEFKTIKSLSLLPPLPRRQTWLVPVAAVAILLLLAAITLPNFIRARNTVASSAMQNNLRQIEAAKQQWALEQNKPATAVPTMEDLKPYLKGGELPASVAGETYVLGPVGLPPTLESTENQPRTWFFRRSAQNPPSQAIAMATTTDAPKQDAQEPAYQTQTVSKRRDLLRGGMAERYDHQGTARSPSAQIVLPTPVELDAEVTATAVREASELGVQFGTWTGGGRPGSLAEGRKTGEAAVGQSVSDPEWAGVLERPALPHSTDNRFVTRYDSLQDRGISPTTSLPLPEVAAVGKAATEIPLAFTHLDNDGSLDLLKSAGQPVAGAEADAFRRRYGLEATPSQRSMRGQFTESIERKVAPLPALAPPPGSEQTTVVTAGIAPADTTVEMASPQPGYPATDEVSVARITPTKPFADKLPVLGDLPALGGALQMERTTSQTRSRPSSAPQPLPPADQPKLEVAAAESDALHSPGRVRSQGYTNLSSTLTVPRVNVERADSSAAPGSPTPQDSYSSEMVGYAAVPVESSAVALEATKESLRRHQSRIVLPPNSAGAGVAIAGNPLQNPRGLIEAGRTAAAEVRVEEVLKNEPANLAAGEYLSLAREPQQTDASKLGAEGTRKGIAQFALAAETAVASQPYYDRQRELAEAERFRQLLAEKIVSAGIDQTLPKGSAVEIVDRAEARPSESPTLLSRLGRVLRREREATARIKIEPNASHTAGFSEGQSLGAYDPYFIQTEFEAIKSEAVLGKVVNGLKLDEAWAEKRGGESLKKEEAIAMLRQQLDLRPARDSGLVEIHAKSDNPEEAAQIANAVAEAYRDHRLEQGRELAARGIAGLEDRMAEQEQKIVQTKAELERLGRQANLDADVASIRKPATNAPIPQPEIQTRDNAFSTFSLNVSDVSLKLAAASLEQGQMPDAASVRAEEFINAFDYRDPEPPPGVPVAFAWERARYPFAHNRDLLRFSLKTGAAGRQAGRALNLVLLLDNSGSMERADRVQIIREALRVLAGQLQPQDKLSVISFARTARLVADGVSGDKAGQVLDQVGGLTPQGGTNLEEAMNLGYATALRHYLAHGLNRVVLLTDGAANLGNVEPESLKQKVEAHRKQGVALDCFGIGWEGFNDDLLEVLARNGDGRYGFINTPDEAATEFAGQLAGALQVAASDVKVQVEFNPKRVTAYRQIGYAKHQLTKEQFRDNTVDAAEIAAQEAGNALYTVEVNPAGEGPLGIVRCRFKIPGTTDYREHEWAVPYTGNAVSLEQASPAMRLAATASAFAEWLVVSPFAAEVTPDALLGYLSGVPEVFGADARPKKLEWMIRQAKSLGGK